jgi:hypothetical protein
LSSPIPHVEQTPAGSYKRACYNFMRTAPIKSGASHIPHAEEVDISRQQQ